jgi:hypothetical protein
VRREEASIFNAQIEGVADRVEVKDGDARSRPFPLHISSTPTFLLPITPNKSI